MHNFYKMLHLNSADAPISEIQKQCKAIAQSGELPIEHVKKIYAVLSDSEKRAQYNVALRQSDPDFFKPSEPLESSTPNIPIQNFYFMLNLTSADVDERTIQKHLQKAVSSGEISLEIGQQIRDTLLNADKRSVYDQALRQSDPDFFRPPENVENDDVEEYAEESDKSIKAKIMKAKLNPEFKSMRDDGSALGSLDRNIFLSLFILGIVAMFLPWIQASELSLLGYKVNIISPFVFAWCAFLVIKTHMDEEELEYSKLLLAIFIIGSAQIHFVMRILKHKVKKTSPVYQIVKSGDFTYGVGFYLSMAVIVAICVYLLIYYMKKREF